MNLKFRLINYFDVWYNDYDNQWEVNNLCSEGELFLTADYSKKDIIQALIDFGFLREHVTPEMIEVFDHGDLIELFESRDDVPLGRLELIR